MSIRVDINHQIGLALSSRKSLKRGFIVAYRPYEKPDYSPVKFYGTIGDMLAAAVLPYGLWIVEVDDLDKTERHLLRWNQTDKVWENLGQVRFGVL